MRRNLNTAILFALISLAITVDGQTPTFTFQGRLTDSTSGGRNLSDAVFDLGCCNTRDTARDNDH